GRSAFVGCPIAIRAASAAVMISATVGAPSTRDADATARVAAGVMVTVGASFPRPMRYTSYCIPFVRTWRTFGELAIIVRAISLSDIADIREPPFPRTAG